MRPIVRHILPVLFFYTASMSEAAAAVLRSPQIATSFGLSNAMIVAGEMHYSRVPPEYWQHRLSLLASLGLNTVSTYSFWNLHEPSSGNFGFSGAKDVALFCRMANELGLKVIIRPGPYVCAEWDFGGVPWWLLKNPSMKVRTRNAEFLAATRSYLIELGKQLAPLQASKGGPIIMVQVENEYDAYGKDPRYINVLTEFMREAGFDVPFFTSEMTWSLNKTTHTNLFATIGLSRDAEKHFQKLRAFQPSLPLMAGEFYTGWYDSWGVDSSRPLVSQPQKHFLEALDWMLENKVSFSLYMLHGGTSFGFTSGANAEPCPRPRYDYDLRAVRIPRHELVVASNADRFCLCPGGEVQSIRSDFWQRNKTGVLCRKFG